MESKKQFYKNFFSMYVALVLQNVITLSVNLADNIMLGAYSETALAGVAAVNQIQFVYQQLLAALGEGVVILGSQYWGKKQIQPMKKIAASAMQSALCIALFLFGLTSLFPGQAVGLFTSDVPIIAEGAEYLQVIRFTYFFFAVTQLLLAVLRSVETVKIAFYLSIMTFFVNCGINYCLIFGNLGAPEMETAVLIGFLAAKERKLSLRFSDFFRFDRMLVKDYFRISAPLLFTQGLWGINTALQTAILGHMTAAAIAANSAASTLFLIVKSTAVGAASAASILIGKTIGSGNIETVKQYARRLQKMFVVIGLISAVFLFFIRIPVLSLYDLKPSTKEMADSFLIILSVACAGMSYQMPTNIGIIRGGGDAAYVVKLDLISIWCIVLPVSFIMAFVVKASPVVVVCCLNADQVFKCVPAFLKVNYGQWVRKLTRDEA